MKIENQGLAVRYRKKANDIYFTPEELAKKCISMVPLSHSDVVLDPAEGEGVFINNYPEFIKTRIGMDINKGSNFLKYKGTVDWCITNPPYSLLNDYLKTSIEVCRVGFAYLVGSYSITPKRLKMCGDAGFGLYSMHLCKVSRWFGMTCFVVFLKDYDEKKIKFTYDRKVYNIGYSRNKKHSYYLP